MLSSDTKRFWVDDVFDPPTWLYEANRIRMQAINEVGGITIPEHARSSNRGFDRWFMRTIATPSANTKYAKVRQRIDEINSLHNLANKLIGEQHAR